MFDLENERQSHGVYHSRCCRWMTNASSQNFGDMNPFSLARVNIAQAHNPAHVKWTSKKKSVLLFYYIFFIRPNHPISVHQTPTRSPNTAHPPACCPPTSLLALSPLVTSVWLPSRTSDIPPCSTAFAMVLYDRKYKSLQTSYHAFLC